MLQYFLRDFFAGDIQIVSTVTHIFSWKGLVNKEERGGGNNFSIGMWDWFWTRSYKLVSACMKLHTHLPVNPVSAMRQMRLSAAILSNLTFFQQHPPLWSLDYKGIYGNNVAHFYFSLTTLKYLRWYVPQGETLESIYFAVLWGKKHFWGLRTKKVVYRDKENRLRSAINSVHVFWSRPTYASTQELFLVKMKSLFVF